jgi:hypothetical protein
MPDLSSDPDGHRVVRAELERIAGELVERVYVNNVQAVALVFVDADGDLSTRIAFQVGTKLPLLAGTVLLQQGMIDEMKTRTPKPIDPENKEPFQ